MPNISFSKMSLETNRQPAANMRDKNKLEFRLAASLNTFSPRTQTHWERWGHLPALHVPQHVLRGAGMGQHASLSSASPTELELICAEPERLFRSPCVVFQLTSFAFKVLHPFCHIWSDLATATQWAQRAGLAVILLQAFSPPGKMEIQTQAFSAKSSSVVFKYSKRLSSLQPLTDPLCHKYFFASYRFAYILLVITTESILAAT